MKKLPALIFLSSIILVACQWDGYEPEPTEPDTIEESYKLDYDEMRDLSSAMVIGEAAKQNLAWWAYQENVDWIEGTEYRDSGQLRIDVFKSKNEINIDLEFDLGHLTDIPSVYNSDFHENEEADYLEVEVNVKNDKNNKGIKFVESLNLSTENTGAYQFVLNSSHFKDVPVGMADLTMTIETTLVTFFGKKSKVHPVRAKVYLPYLIPTIYQTDIYFKSLRLNETETMDKLGDNDWSDPTPEAGISIEYGDQSILYEYSKNSFNYVRNHHISVYHCSPNDFVSVRALDIDYGFNGNDLIKDTLISLKNLEGTTYHNLKMKYVDELLIYSKFIGVKNQK